MAKRSTLPKPQYDFLLNPHEYTRLSTCPRCERLTYPRKFALLIHINGHQPLVLGKTCKFCAKCQFIICHQDELDALLAQAYEKIAPDAVGKNYLVLGTLPLKNFAPNLDSPNDRAQTLDGLVPFKEYRTLNMDPGGWRHKDADPKKFVITHAVAEARRETPWTARRGPDRDGRHAIP